MKISVLIITFNERVNIAACLESVSWSDDVLVLDSFSADGTAELARSAGVRVLQNQFVSFAQQRNFGLSEGGFKHEWVLHLDADELVSSALRDEMLQATKTVRLDAYRMSSRMMFQGRWLKHAGLFPWYQVRLGRKDRLSFVQVGHGQRESLAPEKIGTLKESLVHYSFSKGIFDWVEKHNRYSTAEAVHHSAAWASSPPKLRQILSIFDPSLRRRALKSMFYRLPGRPILRFIYMYFFRLGLLDGSAGFNYCCLLSFYECLISLKIAEARQQMPGQPLVVAPAAPISPKA